MSAVLIHFTDAFSSSKEGRKCEDDCPKACEHVEYETSLSYANLQKDVFVDYFMEFLKGTPMSTASMPLYREYQPFLNMTTSERHDYIE